MSNQLSHKLSLAVIGAGSSGLTFARTASMLGFRDLTIYEANKGLTNSALRNQGIVLSQSTLDSMKRLDNGLYHRLCQAGTLTKIKGLKNDQNSSYDEMLPKGSQSSTYVSSLFISRDAYLANLLHTPLPNLLSSSQDRADISSNPVLNVQYNHTLTNIATAFTDSKIPGDLARLSFGSKASLSSSVSEEEQATTIIGADGVMSTVYALTHNRTEPSFDRLRSAPNETVLVEGWAPLTSQLKSLIDEANEGNDTDVFTYSSRGVRFTSTVVPTPPRHLLQPQGEGDVSSYLSSSTPYVYWRCQVPLTSYKSYNIPIPSGTLTGYSPHTTDSVFNYTDPVIAGKGLSNLDASSANILDKLHSNLPFSLPHIHAIVSSTTPSGLSITNVYDSPIPGSFANTDFKSILTGNALFSTLPDTWLNDSLKIDTTHALVMSMFEQAISGGGVQSTPQGPYIEGHVSMHSAVEHAQRLTFKRVSGEQQRARSEAETNGETSRFMSSISLFASQYVPPTIKSQTYKQAYHHNVLKDFEVAFSHIKTHDN